MWFLHYLAAVAILFGAGGALAGASEVTLPTPARWGRPAMWVGYAALAVGSVAMYLFSTS